MPIPKQTWAMGFGVSSQSMTSIELFRTSYSVVDSFEAQASGYALPVVLPFTLVILAVESVGRELLQGESN